MSGLGGLNKSEHGVVVGLVQLQLPVVKTAADLAAQTQRSALQRAKITSATANRPWPLEMPSFQLPG